MRIPHRLHEQRCCPLGELSDQLRAAAEPLKISAMSVMLARKKAIAALRQQLSGGG
ncbi:MAG: hypothetical protein VKK94_01130 [Cyanobacteriota bacterium]|nr:hypothetical protein [Cyanobacteriota bacterium]